MIIEIQDSSKIQRPHLRLGHYGDGGNPFIDSLEKGTLSGSLCSMVVRTLSLEFIEIP
jgi:hypothetical protein